LGVLLCIKHRPAKSQGELAKKSSSDEAEEEEAEEKEEEAAAEEERRAEEAEVEKERAMERIPRTRSYPDFEMVVVRISISPTYTLTPSVVLDYPLLLLSFSLYLCLSSSHTELPTAFRVVPIAAARLQSRPRLTAASPPHLYLP
jgi:hypothetical protein